MGAFKQMIIEDVEFEDSNLTLFEDDSFRFRACSENKELVHAGYILSEIVPLTELIKQQQNLAIRSIAITIQQSPERK